MSQLLRYFIVYVLISVGYSLTFNTVKKFGACAVVRPSFLRCLSGGDCDRVPTNGRSSFKNKASQNFVNALALLSINGLLTKSRANAIGNSYLSQQRMVLQDIAFNVQDREVDFAALNALFQETLKVVRQGNAEDGSTLVLGFGPDTFNPAPNFYPGVSSFTADGCHATISLRSPTRSDDLVEIFDKGNGVQYVRVGNELLRISKGIEKGMKLKYAYGWVDADSPSDVPVEVVVGLRRDPLMFTCIQVSNMKESIVFFQEQLGMQQLPLPLARQPGSQFEPQQPDKSMYVGYSDDSMGLLLIPAPKGVVVNVGTVFEGFTVVVDDEGEGWNPPPAVQSTLAIGKTETDASKISPTGFLVSPDGYKFKLVKYSDYQKIATKTIDF